MAKIVDRLLLFIFTVSVIALSVVALLCAFGLIPPSEANRYLHDVYFDAKTAVPFIAATIVLLLIALRLFYISVRPSRANAPSINQRTEFGEFRVSYETIENLALKTAGRIRGVRDLRTRVSVNPNAGLEIAIRTVVDGETSIPALTEEMQTAVKEQIETITGFPVADVTVYVANIVQPNANTFKSRVE